MSRPRQYFSIRANATGKSTLQNTFLKLSVPGGQTPAGVTRAHCRHFMDRGPEGMSGVPGTGGSTSSSSSSSTSSSSYSSVRPEEGPKEKQEAPEAEYLTSRCVLFTYYQGDISSVVDEHFSRALSSYMDGEGKRGPSEPGTGTNAELVHVKVPFIRGTYIYCTVEMFFLAGMYAFWVSSFPRSPLVLRENTQT